jgi:hypothetical protein
LGKPLTQWERELQLTLEPKKRFLSSQFWRESQIAFETGKYEKYWELTQEDKAWLIAVVETKNLLRNVVDYVDEQDIKVKAAQDEMLRNVNKSS